MRTVLVAGVVGSVIGVAMACHPASRTPPAATAPDSLTGIISITGTSFEQHLVLRSSDRVTRLSAAKSDSAALSRMGGVEVLVVGKRTPDHFNVARFTAIKVAGEPVVDGVVAKAGDRLVLETTRGPIPLGNPPTALRTLIGARVWIGGPLDKGPNTYGVIVPAQ